MSSDPVQIPLGNGRAAIVSHIDAHWISQRPWHFNARGYAAASLFGGRGGGIILMHRLILLAPDTATVDHANGDTLDNRRENLRLATQSQQNANRLKFVGTSRFKGVYLRCDGLKWVAQIGDPQSGRRKNLGGFVTEEEAARVYDDAARAMFGEFACVNFPKPGERRAERGPKRPHR